MIDVKKLITGFLILATAAVCSGLIFSLTNITSGMAEANSAQQIAINGGAAITGAVGTNAFIPTQAQVEQVAAAYAPELTSSTMFVSSTNPNNLTDDVAAEFVNGVVAANPNGPTGTDANGNPTFNSPDVNAIATNIGDATSTENLQVPDWDVEVASIPLTVVATSSAKAMVSYANNLNDILANKFETSQAENILSETDSASSNDLVSIELDTQGALQDIASLKVPFPAKAYQESLLAELVYEKNMIQLYNLSQTDPVKASIYFQQEDQKFDAVQQNFQDQGNLLAADNVSIERTQSNDQNKLLSFLYDTFAIQQANAQAVPVSQVFNPAATIAAFPDPPFGGAGLPSLDIGSQENANINAAQANANAKIAALQQDIANIQDQANASSLFGLITSIHIQNMGQRLEALLKNTLLQILKNTLVSIIQREVLSWIQGSGAPKFITNWGTQLVNAAQTAAINAINAKMSCGTFPAFIPQLQVTLKAFYQSGNNACANQFAAALGSNSFQQFYNNFKNGGFVAFGASTLPSGNPYGSLFFSAQSISVSFSNQQGASGLQAQASQGLNSTLVCDDHSNPMNGIHYYCHSSSLGDYNNGTSATCNAGYTSIAENNNNLCADGSQPYVSTPAAATGFVLQSGIDATPKQLAAANDITGVLNAVLNSLLTGLASAAVNAAGQVVNQGLTALNASNITAGATPPPADLAALASSTSATADTASTLSLECSPISQTIAPLSGTIPTVITSSSVAINGTSTVVNTVSTSPAPTSLSATGGMLDVNGNTPVYYWTDSNGASSTGPSFSDIFTTPGTYTITLTDSTGDAPATCTVIQQ